MGVAMMQEIERALFTHVDSFVLSTQVPIAWPNVTFTKPNDGKYLQVLHFPNTPVDYDWSDYAITHRGILQINVHWSLNVGTVVMHGIVDELTAKFPKGSTLSDGGISVIFDSVPNVLSIVKNDELNYIPIRVFYRSV